MRNSQKCSLPKRLVVHSSGHLREPIVEGPEEREENAAHDDVVEVRHHEIRIAELPVEGRGAQHDPGQARDQELKQEGDAKQHRRLEVNLPAPHGGEPVEDLDSGGNRDGHGRQHKKGVSGRTHADREHVVGPDAHADKSDAHRCRHHDRVAENRLAGENGNDFGSERKSGNDEHINFRMAEDPEEVHPHHRRTSGLRVEEMSAQVAIDQQHQLRGRERTDGENHQPRHGEIEPGQQRHFPERHALATHAEDGGDDVDGSSDAADAGNQQRQSPEVRAVSGRKCLRGQGSVGEPADVRSVACSVKSVAADETEIEQQSAESRHPEAEGVQTRKRHIARANHQGNQVIRESKHHRHGDEEDHGGAMHGEHAVEHLRRDEVVVRTDQLDAHDRRFHSSDHEKHQRIEDVQDAEAFVIDGGHPLVEFFESAGAAPCSRSECDGFSRHVHLLKGCQVFRYSGCLSGAQTHGRHLASGFDDVRIINPARRSVARVFSTAPEAMCLPAHQMRKIGAVGAHAPPCPQSVWQLTQAVCFEDPLALGLRAGVLRGLALLANPPIEILARVAHTRAEASWRAAFRNIARTGPRTARSHAGPATCCWGDSV